MEKQLLVKNLKINYKIVGEGKPMVILHGWPSSSDKWQEFSEYLAKKGIQSIILDLPGFGKSQEPTVPWSLDAYMEFVSEFCEKVPELEQSFYLLGHSFGGALSAKFALQYNQKVEKLFLISAACIRKKTTRKNVLYRLAKIGKVFSFLPYYQMARKVFYKFIIRKSDYPHISGIMKETYLKVISDDLSQKLGFIKVPTIIIWGGADTSTPIEDAHFINKKIPKSQLIIIPEADHSLHIKLPELLSEKVSEKL